MGIKYTHIFLSTETATNALEWIDEGHSLFGIRVNLSRVEAYGWASKVQALPASSTFTINLKER